MATETEESTFVERILRALFLTWRDLEKEKQTEIIEKAAAYTDWNRQFMSEPVTKADIESYIKQQVKTLEANEPQRVENEKKMRKLIR